MPLTFSAALIAGGKSTRMGRDKCLLELPSTHGQVLWKHQLGTLQRLGAREIVISARPEQTYFQPHTIILDVWPDTGPLGGIASVLQQLTSPLLAVLAVDLPDITQEIFTTLLAACTTHCGAVFQTETGYEPLVAIYPQSMLPSALNQLGVGNFRLQAWVQLGVAMQKLTALPLPIAWRAAFRNLNAPSDQGAS